MEKLVLCNKHVLVLMTEGKNTFVVNDNVTVVDSSFRLPVVSSFVKSPKRQPDLQLSEKWKGDDGRGVGALSLWGKNC